MSNLDNTRLDLEREPPACRCVLCPEAIRPVTYYLEEFELFPYLPSRLRRKIWSYALDNIRPRTISIAAEPRGNTILALLHTNSEARYYALNRYFPVHRHKNPNIPPDRDDQGTFLTFFFNHKLDAILSNYDLSLPSPNSGSETDTSQES